MIRLCEVCSKEIERVRVKYVPTYAQCTKCWLKTERQKALDEGRLPLSSKYEVYKYAISVWCGDHVEVTTGRNGKIVDDPIVGYGLNTSCAWAHYNNQLNSLKGAAKREWQEYRKVLEAPIEDAKAKEKEANKVARLAKSSSTMRQKKFSIAGASSRIYKKFRKQGLTVKKATMRAVEEAEKLRESFYSGSSEI